MQPCMCSRQALQAGTGVPTVPVQNKNKNKNKNLNKTKNQIEYRRTQVEHNKRQKVGVSIECPAEQTICYAGTCIEVLKGVKCHDDIFQPNASLQQGPEWKEVCTYKGRKMVWGTAPPPQRCVEMLRKASCRRDRREPATSQKGRGECAKA